MIAFAVQIDVFKFFIGNMLPCQKFFAVSINGFFLFPALGINLFVMLFARSLFHIAETAVLSIDINSDLIRLITDLSAIITSEMIRDRCLIASLVYIFIPCHNVVS